MALNDLASVARLSHDYATAERDYREALKIANKIGEREGVASCTGNLAELALDRSDWPAAEELARQALALAEEVGRQELIGSNCRRLAEAMVRQRRPTEGLPYAQRAVATCAKLRLPGDLAYAQAVLKECESPLDSK